MQIIIISLSYIYERLLYSTGKTSTWCKSAEKPPPPHFCLLVRYSTRIAAHDITLRTDISCIIEPHFGFCGRKAPPPGWGKIFWLQIYPFQAISSNFGFCGRKAPPPPPTNEGNFFDCRFIRFRQFRATLVFVAEKPPPQYEGKNFDHRFLPFQAISSNFGFCGRKAPPPPRMREIFLTSDLSVSGNFKQLWFLWQKSPPPKWGKFFDCRFIRFRQFRATLVLWQKSPPPHMREKFLTADFSISGNFEQLWFLWQKSPPPPPPGWGKIFWLQIYRFRQFEQLWFLWQKSPPPKDEGNFFDRRFSVSGNFKQLWFLWQKTTDFLEKTADFCRKPQILAKNRGFLAENHGFYKNHGFWLKTADFG